MFFGVFYCKNGHELRGISYIDEDFSRFWVALVLIYFQKNTFEHRILKKT